MNQDGLYVTYESIQDSINDGVFDEISVLSGTNLGEGSYPQVSTADDFYAQYKEALGDLYDKYDFENLVKVDDNTAAMVSRQLGTYGLGTNVSRSLMVNRLYGKMMSERTDGKAANYTYLFSHSTPESISDLGTDRGWANQWAWHTSEMWYAFNSLREGVPAVRQWTDWDYELAEKMNKISLRIQVKAGENGKIFGGVSAKDIADAFEKQHNIKIDKKKVDLKETIKTLGVHTVSIKLFEGVIGKIKVDVIG